MNLLGSRASAERLLSKASGRELVGPASPSTWASHSLSSWHQGLKSLSHLRVQAWDLGKAGSSSREKIVIENIAPGEQCRQVKTHQCGRQTIPAGLSQMVDQTPTGGKG